MRKYLMILLVGFIFFGCKANTDISETTTNTESKSTGSESRDSSSQTKSYPKLKVENNKTSGEFIFLVELPNYIISPLEIRSGESMTFELNKGMYCYNNVTVHLNYGFNRNYHNDVYVRKDFADGQTTTITLE